MKTSKRVVRALIKYAKENYNTPRHKRKISKFSVQGANNFFLGVMLDRSINADYAWNAAKFISETLGDPIDSSVLWKKLYTLEKRRLLGFLRYGNGGYAFHRHYKTFAHLLPKSSLLLLEKYDGDPRNIWNGQRDIDDVRKRLEEFPCIGPALSRMTILILSRDYGLLGGAKAKKQLDIKPDIHVKRVFMRSGIIQKGASDKDVIKIARVLSPSYPGMLDNPAFNIGRNICRPTKPLCKECPLDRVCLKKF